MKITESRANDILRWLDDEAGNHALLFEKMTLHRDAAALIRQLQAAEHAAAMRGFLLDLRSDLREPAEREGGLFLHFHRLVCEQLGMTPNAKVSGGGTPSAGLPGYAAGEHGERK